MNAYTVTVRPNRNGWKTLTWTRYAASIEEATESAGNAVAEEFCGDGCLVSVEAADPAGAMTPYEHGQHAYLAGKPAAPALDRGFASEHLAGQPGTHAAALAQWLRGWHDANLASNREALADLMRAWRTIEQQAQAQLPGATGDEIYRAAKAAMDQAIGLTCPQAGA